jgi:hypothetical protein
MRRVHGPKIRQTMRKLATKHEAASKVSTTSVVARTDGGLLNDSAQRRVGVLCTINCTSQIPTII